MNVSDAPYGAEGSGSDFDRARNLILLTNEGQPISHESDKWLMEYMLSCPIEQIDELHRLQSKLED